MQRFFMESGGNCQIFLHKIFQFSIENIFVAKYKKYF